MRVCLVCGGYPPAVSSGISVYTRSLVGALKKADESADLFVLAPYAVPEKTSEVTIIKSGKQTMIFTSFMKILRLKPDIVHVQFDYSDFGGTDNVGLSILIMLLRLFKKPIVTTFHEIYPVPSVSRNKIKAVLKYFIFRVHTSFILFISDVVIFHTERASKVAEEEFSFSQGEIISHGTLLPDAIMSAENAKKILGLTEKKLLMIFGSLRLSKRIETALNSLPLVLKKHPEILLLIVGRVVDQNYLDMLKKLVVDLCLSDRVRFIGFVKEEVISTYFSAADIILLPYGKGYGSGSSVLHLAAAYGKPIIASKGWEAEEVLNKCPEGGISLTRLDPKSLGRAIIRTFDFEESERSRMGNLLRASLQHTSWVKIAGQHIRLYNKKTHSERKLIIKSLIAVLGSLPQTFKRVVSWR